MYFVQLKIKLFCLKKNFFLAFPEICHDWLIQKFHDDDDMVKDP